MIPPPSGLANAAGSQRQEMVAASIIRQISPTRGQARTRLYRDGRLELEGFPVADISDYLADDSVAIWLDLRDPDHDDLAVLSEEFGLHPLAVEDALHHSQRPKLDRYRRQLRKSLVLLRRIMIPLREVVGELMRRDLRVVGDDLMPLLPGCLRSGAACRRVDSLRDLVTGTLEMNVTIQGNRLNVITKKVTGWAAIIAVPTLITGFFGMNVPYPGFGEKPASRPPSPPLPWRLWCSTSFSSARIGCKSEDREAGQLAALLALKFHQ